MSDRGCDSSRIDSQRKGPLEARATCPTEPSPLTQVFGALRMQIDLSYLENGFQIQSKFRFLFPTQIWKPLQGKLRKILAEHITYLNTYYYPLLFDVKEMEYNFSLPFLSQYFYKNIILEILVNCDESNLSTDKHLRKFCNTAHNFTSNQAQFPRIRLPKFENKACISLSFGKDSLTSFALAKELGLDPVAVYIKDTGASKENAAKVKMCQRFAKEFRTDVFTIKNELEDLRDSSEHDFGANSLLGTYAIALVPFSIFFRSKYILLGNEQSRNDYYFGREGFIAYPTFDQTSEGTSANSIVSFRQGCMT